MLKLEGILEEIALITNYEVARKIAQYYGGTELVVPANLQPKHKLAKLIGYENAKLISSYFSREKLYIPMAAFKGREERRLDIARMQYNGLSISDIARLHNCSERTVYRDKKEHMLNAPKQVSMFGVKK